MPIRDLSTKTGKWWYEQAKAYTDEQIAGINTGLPDAIVGDYLEVSADTEEEISDTTYTKVKEIWLPRGGSYRIKFDLKVGYSGENAYGKIYKNGSPIGTEQTNDTTTYVTKSEDISGFEAGDLVQLYIKGTSGGYHALAKNFRVYSGNPIIPQVNMD